LVELKDFLKFQDQAGETIRYELEEGDDLDPVT
jgi:hypothetical protein